VLPFVNANYRANIRVVDFWPDNIKDFSVGRKVTDLDALSDYSGGESTDHEEDMRQYQEGKGYGGQKEWSWRFALRVEDANKKATKDSEMLWLLVDDKEGQMLLDRDAVE
jgi:protection of telomeres protein 1